MHKIDNIDKKIIALLQKNALMTVEEISKKVGLSKTPCWRRIQAMEESGLIKRRVAIINPEMVNVGVSVFVSIKTNQHSQAWCTKFAKVIEEFPEIQEAHRMSGNVDYLLRVVVPDIQAYDEFYKKLITKIDLTDVNSTFSMEKMKFVTALPLEYIDTDV